MNKGINEAKTLGVNLEVFNMIKEINESKILMKHISSECRCEDCEISDYLKDCTCTKILVDDLVLTCNEVVETPEKTSSTNSNDKKITGLSLLFY